MQAKTWDIDSKTVLQAPVDKIPVIFDQDKNIVYERNELGCYVKLPIMWLLTFWVILKKVILGNNLKTNTFWFDGLSKSCRQIKEGAASWRALDIIYNFQFGCENKLSDFWLGIMNAQAVRNRLKLVKRELKDAIKEISKNSEQIRLLSLACGSAQAVIEVMAELKELDIRATLVDLDLTAIAYATRLAEKYEVKDKIVFVVGSISNLERSANGTRPHIIEMVGFLDYRSKDKAVHLVHRISNILVPGGIFLTANMCPNPEQHFLKWVINWSIIYRKPRELAEIITEGGFPTEGCRIVCEPYGLHAVAICRRNLFDP